MSYSFVGIAVGDTNLYGYVAGMQNLVFRRATPDDADRVSAISREAYGPAYYPLIHTLPRPATEDYQPWIGKGLVWLCEDRGNLVGVLVLEKHLAFWMIWSVAVDPVHQGRGLGGRLLEVAMELAQREDVSRLRLHTNSRMKNNIALYRKAGFRQTDVIPHPSHPGHSLVYMELDLGGTSERKLSCHDPRMPNGL